LDGLLFLPIDAERNWSERDFEESEILEVVSDLNGDKALGPNRFSMAFFLKCWEVLEVFKEFHSRGTFEKSINATFVSFIPRKASAVDIKNFCFISLVGGVCKLFLRS